MIADGDLMSVYGMRAYVGRYDRVTVDVKRYSQVTLDHHRINGSIEDGGKALNFMRPQPGIEWIHLEDMPGVAH